MLKQYKYPALISFLILTLAALSYCQQSRLEISFKNTLHDIQQNSIKNWHWKEADWKEYYNKQLGRLPIFTQKYFYACIEGALKDLGDNHSFLIRKHESSNAQSSQSADKIAIKIEDGIGIINFPTLMTEVDQFDALLHENWVIEAHKIIENAAPQVTHGWIIDLTKNAGGNMYPMLAALSYFYNEPTLGGFYSLIKNQKEKTIVLFDGQTFTFDDQNSLSYKTKFKTNQNKLPVIVLIGHDTASSAEFLALALKRQKNITLAGQESYGLATANEVMQLPNNLGSYMLTVAYYLDSNDQPLFEEKVRPSIVLDGDENMINQAKKLLKNSFSI